MNTRATLALFLIAGRTAAAQELFNVSYSWLDVLEGGQPNPFQNGIVSPGEGARITITVQAMLNAGGSAIGALTTYPPPIPAGGNGTGTIKGLGSAFYDLMGDLGAASAAGTWHQVSGPVNSGNHNPSNVFNYGTSGGSLPPGGDGSSLVGFGGTQVVSPGDTANSNNSNVRVFIGTWVPTVYSNRVVNFKALASSQVAAGQQNSLLVAYGQATGYADDFFLFTYDLYLTKYIGTDFGVGVNIPIVPEPSALALLGLGALVASSHRRTRTSQQTETAS